MRTVVALALGLLSQAATAEELSFVCAGASFDVKTRALSLAREETLVIDVKNAAMLWRRWRVPRGHGLELFVPRKLAKQYTHFRLV